jgi:hypothetical protein
MTVFREKWYISLLLEITNTAVGLVSFVNDMNTIAIQTFEINVMIVTLN